MDFYRVELSRGGRCWGESFTYLIQANSVEEAEEKVLKHHQNSDPHTFQVETESFAWNTTEPMKVNEDYWDR